VFELTALVSEVRYVSPGRAVLVALTELAAPGWTAANDIAANGDLRKPIGMGSSSVVSDGLPQD
jgi:hypothetical protein